MAPKTQYLDDDGNPITAPAGMKLPPGYTLLSSKKDSTPKKSAKSLKELKAQAETMKPIVPPKGYLLKPEASVSAYTPSVFEQLRNTVANSAVGYSLEQALPKVADALHLHPTEKMGTLQSEQHKNQLVSPEYLAPALTEAIRTGPLMQAPAPKEGRAPDATSNRIEGALRASGGLTTPGNMALMAVTGAAGAGVGEISPAAANVLGRMASGGFTLQMLKGLYDQHKEYRKAVDAGDINEAQKIQGEMGVNGVMALLAGKHALAPHPVAVPVEEKANVEPATPRPNDGMANGSTDKGVLPSVAAGGQGGTTEAIQSAQPSVQGTTGGENEYPTSPPEDTVSAPIPDVLPQGTAEASTPGLEQKPLHEMSPAEIEEEHEKAKNRDKQDVIDIFGEEDAKKYNRLQKASNNPYDTQRADRASAELQEMESNLTPEQQNKLYGIGDTRHTLEDLRDYRDAYHGLDDSSPEALGNSLKWAVSQVGDPTRAPETMTPKERVRLAQLRYGYEDAVKNGYDPMEVMKAAVKSAAGRFSDPNDARIMLQDVVKVLYIDEPKQPQLTGGDEPHPTLGKQVIRYGGGSEDVNRPHGLYTSLVENGHPSAHNDLGSPVAGVAKGKKVLDVHNEQIEHPRFGDMKSGGVDAGVGALKQLSSPEEFEKFRKMSKQELIDYLTEKYPGHDYSKFYDAYELLGALGASKARSLGYDALYRPDEYISKMDAGYREQMKDHIKDFTEYVGLHPDAISFSRKSSGQDSGDDNAPTASRYRSIADTGSLGMVDLTPNDYAFISMISGGGENSNAMNISREGAEDLGNKLLDTAEILPDGSEKNRINSIARHVFKALKDNGVAGVPIFKIDPNRTPEQQRELEMHEAVVHGGQRAVSGNGMARELFPSSVTDKIAKNTLTRKVWKVLQDHRYDSSDKPLMALETEAWGLSGKLNRIGALTEDEVDELMWEHLQAQSANHGDKLNTVDPTGQKYVQALREAGERHESARANRIFYESKRPGHGEGSGAQEEVPSPSRAPEGGGSEGNKGDSGAGPEGMGG